jgi:hypothetical protein
MKKEEIYVYVSLSNITEARRLLEKYNQPIGDIDVRGHNALVDGYHYLVFITNDDENNEWFVDNNDNKKVRCTLSQLEGILKGDTFTLPEMWCIEVTNENIDVLGNWRSDGPFQQDYTMGGWYLHTPMNDKNGYNLQRKDSDYTEITFEQFKTYVLKQNNMNTNTISRTDLGKIHNIACPTWKTKLEKLGSRNPFSGTIELTQSEVDEMFKAATPDQRPTLVNIFGEQSNSVDLTGFKFDDCSSMLAVRGFGEYENKGFYLDDTFKWEIVKDNYGKLVLIPTRK